MMASRQTSSDSVSTVNYGVSSGDDMAAVVANSSLATNADEYPDVSSGDVSSGS